MGDYKFSFEKLEVWQLSRDLIVKIYSITGTFPDTERFGLVSQIRRSSVSIASNLAEGSGRTNKKDQAHFYQIAYGSLLELVNQLIISNDLKYLKDESLINLKEKSCEIANKINALRNKTLTRKY